MRFRDARPEESELLACMVRSGIGHWGHDVNFPDAVAGLEASGLPTRDFIADNTVEVLADGDDPVGFFSLVPFQDAPDVVELVHMFMVAERIGTGCGRTMWDRATGRARHLARRMLIMSDPEAIGFYAAMGATLESEVEISPGFALGRMWYELGGKAPNRSAG